MRAVTYFKKIVRSDARLKRTMPSPVGIAESVFYFLHSAADEESRIVVRNDLVVYDQRETELFEAFRYDL